MGLLVTAPETEREHEIRFVLLDPDGAEVAGATGSLTARGSHDGRDSILTFSIDLWNVTFPAPGDYSFRILVNGSERKRLPLRHRRAGCLRRPGRSGPARHEIPAIDEAALVAARHADRLLAAADGPRDRPLGDVPPAAAGPAPRRRPSRRPARGDAGAGGLRAEGLGPGRAAGGR